MNASHGPWCGSRTWKTKCPTCEEPVFFFFCNCGCKVFFDELGDPWPIHDCLTSWTRRLTRSTDSDGGITVTLPGGSTLRRPPLDFAIDEKVIGATGKNLQDDPITASEPTKLSSKTMILGTLRELRDNVDPAKELRIDGSSSLARAMLGSLSKGEWAKATVHEPGSQPGTWVSFTFWVRRRELDRQVCSRGVTVAVELVPEELLTEGMIWICESFSIEGLD